MLHINVYTKHNLMNIYIKTSQGKYCAVPQKMCGENLICAAVKSNLCGRKSIDVVSTEERMNERMKLICMKHVKKLTRELTNNRPITKTRKKLN